MGASVPLTETDDRRRQAHGDALKEHLVELATTERNALVGRAPERGEVDVEEQTAVLVQELLPRDLVATVDDTCPKAEPVQRPDRVGW